MTFGEAFLIVLSFCLILMSSIIFYILVKYYDSINFTKRNTVTYLSLYLINICYANVLSLVILYDKKGCSLLGIYLFVILILTYLIQNLSMMIFILFGSVNYPIAVIVRTLHFSTIFMVEGSVIIILIIRQVIILKVILNRDN